MAMRAQVDTCVWLIMFVVVVARLVTSCSPSGPHLKASGCGPPFVIQSPAGTTSLGGCAGGLSTTPSEVRIGEAQLFEISSATDQSASLHSGGLPARA
jgi:hypothetical protein